MDKPSAKPKTAHFSSGPCAKRPGWSLDAVKSALLGRSHRSAPGKAKLQEVIDLHRKILNIPADYRIAIVPASDTGAVEMALWSLLGPRAVDVLVWESFSSDWSKDIKDQLKIKDVRVLKADYGGIPDLKTVDFTRDVVFAWNGTTSGVRVPDGNWIAANREGLTICDATSAVFAYDMPWDKLDVTTWSWQKVLGGEAAHGMLVLSSRAAERLKTYTPAWPMPKIFQMAKKGEITEGLFKGETINTPSLLAVEDCLDALKWVESIGGVKATIARTKANFEALAAWVKKTPWVEFLAEKTETCSWTSVCFKITDPWFTAMDDEARQGFVKSMTKALEKEGAAFDIGSYKAAPAGLRIWGGATIEESDIKALTPWLDWAYEAAKAEQLKKAA